MIVNSVLPAILVALLWIAVKLGQIRYEIEYQGRMARLDMAIQTEVLRRIEMKLDR